MHNYTKIIHVPLKSGDCDRLYVCAHMMFNLYIIYINIHMFSLKCIWFHNAQFPKYFKPVELTNRLQYNLQ